MSSSKLLEQAIVDAQALRDSAFKSAQATLLEKFAPQVKEAVEKLLEQDEEPGADTPSPSDALAGGDSNAPLTDFGGAPPDESNKGYVAGAAKDIPLAATDGEKLCPCPDDDEEVEVNINLADLADALQIGDKEEETDMSPQMTGMMNQPPASGGAGGPSPMMESIELDEDLLDEEMDEDFAGPQGDTNMTLEEDELTEVSLDEVLSEEKEEDEDEESEDEEESDEDDEEESDEDDEEENEEDEEDEELDKEKADLDGDGILTPYEKTRGKATQAAIKKHKEKTNESKTKQLLQASAQLLKEHQNSMKLIEKKDARIQKLLEENNKLSSTVEDMSVAFKKLEEVNTLNARLFYENQVLKSASLNERQKINIVEAISKADSVSEAKTVYETLINSVGGSQREERVPKSLNEAISKKSSFRLPHKQTEQPNDPNKDRWLKLAGIK
jgi:hypothetical protein